MDDVGSGGNLGLTLVDMSYFEHNYYLVSAEEGDRTTTWIAKASPSFALILRGEDLV